MAEALATVRENNVELSIDESIREGIKAFGIITSFPVETDEDKTRLFKAQNTAQPLSDMEGTYIKLVDIAFTSSNMVSADEETGETVDNPAVILIDEDGECFFSASLGVYESVKALINSFGMPGSWESPKQVVTKTRKTRNGRTYRYLDM